MKQPLRVLIVTDIHHNPMDAPPKLCSQGLPLLERVIEESRCGDYDLLIDLGDRIDERNPSDDIALARQVSQAFSRAGCTRAHLMGNHDSYFLGQAEWSQILNAPVASRFIEVKGCRLIFFCPDVNNQRGRFDYSLAPHEIKWLRDALQTELRTVVFSHVPLLAGPLFGNFYFEGKRGRAEYLNASEARSLLSASHAVLAIAGHVHWNSWHSVDGVHYVTLHSLTESFTTHPSPSGAYTVLEIGEDISVEVRGLDPMRLQLPARLPRGLWRRRG